MGIPMISPASLSLNTGLPLPYTSGQPMLPVQSRFQPIPLKPFVPPKNKADLATQALTLGEAFYEQGRFRKAMEAYDIVLQTNGYNPTILNKRGVCKAAIRDNDGAMADYTMALALKPDFYNAWVNRGNLKAYLKDYPGALSDYNQAIVLRPLDTVAYENRSELFSDMQQPEMSLQDRAKVIQLHRIKPKQTMDFTTCPPRIALILANDDYDGTENDLNGGPAKDLSAMQGALEKDGFQVISGFNMTSSQMQQKVNEFINTVRLNPGAVTTIYYSGHGGSINGNNYLIPIDYDGMTDPSFRQNAVSVDYLLKQLATAPSLFNIMILDACRNPLEVPASRGWEAEARPGLSNTWIEYASRKNEPAYQAKDQGLYTKYLIPRLLDPNLSLKEVFMLASYDMEKDPTARAQGQHARSQTDITKSEAFANSFYLGRPCPEHPPVNPFRQPVQTASTPN